MSVNKAFVLGNLGADPEVRFTSSGQAVASLRVATTESWTDKNGEKKEQTEWHRVTVWGKQAERCGEWLHKGDKVYVEGKIQTKEYTDKEGAKKYSTEINASWVEFLGAKRDKQEPKENPPAQQEDAGPDDIPF